MSCLEPLRAAALLPIAARAQPSEVVIGAIYPLSGRQRANRRRCAEGIRHRGRYHQQRITISICRWRGTRGLPGLGGAKMRLVFADHQADPQKGRAEAERLITQEKVCADHRHVSERGRRHRQPDLRALSDSVHLGGQFLAEPAPPRPEVLFPRRRRMTRCSRRRCSISSTR